MATERFYMHTIDGKPGAFDGDQIVYADVMPHWRDTPMPVVLVRQLRTIKRQQARSLAFRKAHGFDTTSRYGWCVVEVTP